MNEISLRSTTQVCPLRVWQAFFQRVLTSETHGPINRPCKTHRISVGVSVMVILSTFTFLVRLAQQRREMRHAHQNALRVPKPVVGLKTAELADI
jgi:hypothetical protein